VIAGVVLAAGRATRFGGGKVVARFRGAEIVRHVIERLAAGGVEEIVVVAGTERELVTNALAGLPATVVENPSPDLGMSSSIRLGAAAIGQGAGAVVIALGDQPLIDPAVVRALIERWERSNAAAVVPVYRDGRGHPVLFDATQCRALRELRGDAGARDLLERLGDRVMRLSVAADAPRDVDTLDDLRELERRELERRDGEAPAAPSPPDATRDG
jgi:CTP:molybdopterin cytidylyltransferase MocA